MVLMDQQSRARYKEELSTQNRARILGVRYQDVALLPPQGPLAEGVLSVPEMY